MTKKSPLEHELGLYGYNHEIISKGNNLLIYIFSGIYILMALATPNTPNTDFYHLLDGFLNTYLFGDLMPDYSEVFSFKAKVICCLSMILVPIQALLRLIWTYYKVGRDGVDDMRNSYIRIINFGKQNPDLILIPVVILILVALIFGPIYAYVSPPEMTSRVNARSFNKIFYGSITPYTSVVIIFQPLLTHLLFPCLFFILISTYKRFISYVRK